MKKINQIKRDELILGLAGDSGDGIQLVGLQLTHSVAIEGKNVNALPDYPAEIRAPAGTVSGVSSYKLKISGNENYTSGDKIDVFFAMNPAALKANLCNLSSNALLIINSDSFNEIGIKKADLPATYCDLPIFTGCTIYKVPVTTLTKEAAKQAKLSHSEVVKSKNMFVLGIISWITNVEPNVVIGQINLKFSKSASLNKANRDIFNAGYNYAETVELFQNKYRIGSPVPVRKKASKLGSGNSAFADACLAAYMKSAGKVFVSGYPITPASTLLQNIAKYQSEYGLRVFQAEDEISSVCSAIGAAYGGFLSLTITSGPGFDLKTEGLGLAVIAELPLVVINVQRAGPSTGMPTKTEQGDLFAAVFGRHGDCPIPVLAPRTPADCYDVLIEAFTLAMKYMTPVIVLSDAYLANAVENIPLKKLSDISNLKPTYPTDSENYHPYERVGNNLSRSWAVPGMSGFEHCVGGLEKSQITGQVCYEGENHQQMVNMRQQKIKNMAVNISEEYFFGEEVGDVLVIGWGSTYGAIKEACIKLHEQSISISMLHIKHLFPLPNGLMALLKRFKKVVVVEQNSGHLATLIRDNTLIAVEQYNVFDGQPASTEKLRLYLMNNFKIGNEKNVCYSV